MVESHRYLWLDICYLNITGVILSLEKMFFVFLYLYSLCGIIISFINSAFMEIIQLFMIIAVIFIIWNILIILPNIIQYNEWHQTFIHISIMLSGNVAFHLNTNQLPFQIWTIFTFSHMYRITIILCVVALHDEWIP